MTDAPERYISPPMQILLDEFEQLGGELDHYAPHFLELCGCDPELAARYYKIAAATSEAYGKAKMAAHFGHYPKPLGQEFFDDHGGQAAAMKHFVKIRDETSERESELFMQILHEDLQDEHDGGSA